MSENEKIDIFKKKQDNKKEEIKNVSGFKANIEGLGDFLYNAFWKTPAEKVETLFEIVLLVAGGSRVYEFMRSMGQSGYMSAFALVYSEIGILIWEGLNYKGKSVEVKKISLFGKKEYIGYNLWNQKSISKAGLIMHLIMSAIFTTSDVIKTNLEAVLGQSSVDAQFIWVLGFMVGITFFLDLVFVLIYKNTDPNFQHEQKMNQLLFEEANWNLEKERIEKQAEIEYERENAPQFARTRAKLKKRNEIISEYGDKLGREYLESELAEIELGKKNKNQNNSNNNNQNQQNQNKSQNQNQQQRPQQNQVNRGEPQYPKRDEAGKSNQNF